MKHQDLTGAVIDRFQYDTPSRAGQDFYTLCRDALPLVMIFLPNFGHPVSRQYLENYRKTAGALVSGRLACVVKSDPQVLAAKGQGDFPFTLICDAAGVLYEYFEVEVTESRWKWSLEASRLFKAAREQGYTPEKTQILPLTLLVGEGGKVLYSHYGESLTDLPEDCKAIEAMCAALAAQPEEEPEEDDDIDEAEAEPEETDEEADDTLRKATRADAAWPAQTDTDENGAGRPRSAETTLATGDAAREDGNPQKWDKLLAEFQKNEK